EAPCARARAGASEGAPGGGSTLSLRGLRRVRGLRGLRGLRLLALRPTRLNALGLPLLLAEVGRPGSVAQALALVAGCQLEQAVEAPRSIVDRRRRVAALGQAGGDRSQRQLLRLDRRDLVPLQRAGHARVGHRAD